MILVVPSVSSCFLLLTTPIKPTESNTTVANSLYECSNMGQLTNYYYACLNYPIKYTLIKAFNRGYLKGWWGLTTTDMPPHLYLHRI
jgi:hypothetical protein